MGESWGFQEFLRDFLQDNEDTSKLIGSDGSILHQPLQINGNHLILMSTDFTCQMAATLVHFLLLPHGILNNDWTGPSHLHDEVGIFTYTWTERTTQHYIKKISNVKQQG